LRRHFITQRRNYNTKCRRSRFTVAPFVLTTLTRMSNCRTVDLSVLANHWLLLASVNTHCLLSASTFFCLLSAPLSSIGPQLLPAPLPQPIYIYIYIYVGQLGNVVSRVTSTVTSPRGRVYYQRERYRVAPSPRFPTVFVYVIVNCQVQLRAISKSRINLIISQKLRL
jgi:hypothetical protein